MTIGDATATMHGFYYSEYILLEDRIIKIKNIENFNLIQRI